MLPELAASGIERRNLVLKPLTSAHDEAARTLTRML
jgi:hypothetical protein